MNCKDVSEKLIDYLDNQLNEREKKEIKNHLKECSQCQEQLNQYKLIFKNIENSSDINPDQKLQNNFNKILEEEKTKIINKNNIYENRFLNKRWMQIAAGIILFISGLIIGFGIKSNNNINNPEISSLKSDINEMKQVLMFSLLKQDSPSARMKAVSYVNEFSEPNQKMIEVLINTLNNDIDVNVRLTALYALEKYSEKENIRMALINSMEHQTEPLVQIILINTLVKLNEKRAITPLKNLIYDENTQDLVKEEAKKGIKNLT